MALKRHLRQGRRKVLYEEYLRTPHWRKTREAALQRAGFRCSRCGATEDLSVHHLTYARLFHERMEDLVVLCRRCHGREHHIFTEEDMIDFNTSKPGGRFSRRIDDAILAAHRAAEKERLETRTPRIGASRIGEECLRRLQYEYFKAPPDREPEGRVLRIFHRGHHGEDWMAGWIRQAGFTLYTADETGTQKCFHALDGKILGYADGVFTGGPEEFAPYPRLWENKVLGSKGWNKLNKEGIRKAYPVYYGQVQLYMAYFDLTDSPAIFTALNADTMDILAEYVEFDPQTAQELSDKAVNLVSACDAGILLPRCTKDEDFFECRFCDYRERCWKQD